MSQLGLVKHTHTHTHTHLGLSIIPIYRQNRPENSSTQKDIQAIIVCFSAIYGIKWHVSESNTLINNETKIFLIFGPSVLLLFGFVNNYSLY